MKIKVCMAVLSMGVLLTGGGLRAGAQEAWVAAPVEFVGVTTASFQGWVGGQFALARACQADFIDSHVCSSAEILQSGRTPDFPEGVERAWVNPSLISILPDLSSPYTPDDYILVDASGATASSDKLNRYFSGMNCKQWGGAGEGLTVTSRGTFSAVNCASTLPVACCVGKASR